MTQTISQKQREAIKTAAKQHYGVAVKIAQAAGISSPTLSRWLATGHGISEKRIPDVLWAVHQLLGLSIDSMTQVEQNASPVSLGKTP